MVRDDVIGGDLVRVDVVYERPGCVCGAGTVDAGQVRRQLLFFTSDDKLAGIASQVGLFEVFGHFLLELTCGD